MNSWCTAEEVNALVQGDPNNALLQEYADLAASTLYITSGRRVAGEATVSASHQINRRGYVRLADWQPVRSIVSATIDGEPAQYALSPAHTFVSFPVHKAGMIAELVMNVGQNPPLTGKRAAAALAAEMLRGDPRYEALGATDTRPTSRLVSVSRQGVTYTYADPGDLAEKDLTGVYAVDLFLRAVNPTGARYQSKVVTT